MENDLATTFVPNSATEDLSTTRKKKITEFHANAIINY